MDILSRNDGRSVAPLPEIPKGHTLARNVIRDDNTDILLKNEENHEHEPHDGFNTNVVCRWCGEIIRSTYIPELKNGRNGKSCSIVLNYEPCSACKDKWKDFIVCIEVTEKELYKNCLPITHNLIQNEITGKTTNVLYYPTGRYTGVYPESAEEIFGTEADKFKEGSVAFFDREMFDKVFGACFINKARFDNF